jgi:hypothetical protein
LIPCSKYIIPKIKLRNKTKTNNIEISQFLNKNNCLNKLNEKSNLMSDGKIKINLEENDFNFIETDINLNVNVNKEKEKDHEIKIKKGNIFFEDIIMKIKKENLVDYKVIKDIIWFLNEDFDYDQIVNLSIYKDELINSTIKKYKYLFNIIIEPLFV